MARGRKKKEVNIDEQIVLVQNEITDLTNKIKEKKKELADLEDAKKAQEQKVLIDAISESGKSVDEVLALLKK